MGAGCGGPLRAAETIFAEREGRGFGGGLRQAGRLELGYSSDLDLIFLHDCPADVMTDGEREIDGRQFYLRLA